MSAQFATITNASVRSRWEQALSVDLSPLAARVILALLGICGALLVIYCTSLYGPALSTDSVAYVSAARSLASGHGYFLYDGAPLLLWGPLLPTVLAAPMLVGFDPVDTARFLNALTFAATIYMTGLFVLASGKKFVMVLLAVALVMLSHTLIQISTYVWSEPPFVLFVLLALWAAKGYLEGAPDKRGPLYVAAIFTALACITRYAGISLVLAVALLLLLDTRLTLFRRVLNITAFGAISTAPLVIWLARNFITSGTTTGMRLGPKDSLLGNIGQTIDTFTGWFVPVTVAPGIRLMLVGSYLTVLFAVGYFALRGNIRLKGLIAKPGPLAAFFIVYLVFTVVTASLSAVDLGDRLYSPVYVPFVILALSSLATVPDLVRGPLMQKLFAFLLIGGLIWWLALSFGRTLTLAQKDHSVGAGGYSTVAWHKSPMIAYLRQHPLDGPIYGNGPDAIYYFTGRSAHWGTYRATPDGLLDDIDHTVLDAEVPGHTSNVYIAWFDNIYATDVASLQQLESDIQVEAVVTETDGALYHVVDLKAYHSPTR